MSVNAFALNIGLRRSENLYQIKRGNNGISRELAETIVAKYPAVSKGWILSGEGEMFAKDTVKSPQKSINFYRRDVVFVASHLNEIDPDDTIRFKRFEDCSFAAASLSPSMDPDIPPGSIVVVREERVQTIIPGGLYLIISAGFSGIRYVRSGSSAEHLRLVPANREAFDEMEIRIDKIELVFSVKSIIIDKFL